MNQTVKNAKLAVQAVLILSQQGLAKPGDYAKALRKYFKACKDASVRPETISLSRYSPRLEEDAKLALKKANNRKTSHGEFFRSVQTCLKGYQNDGKITKMFQFNLTTAA